jgi:transcriptional regulator with XRE-family HTH domain
MPHQEGPSALIGAALAKAFQRRGLTQTQVAVRYGVSQSRVGRIYAGDFTARSGTAQRMCKDTGVKFLDAAADNVRYAYNRRRLMRLLDSVWKGTDEDASYVAEALVAIGRLRQAG